LSANEQLEYLSRQHNGVRRTADAVAAGISKQALAEFVESRGFEKTSHGIYCDPGAWKDPLLLLQLRCPGTVYSHGTALYLHDLTDREPLVCTLTARTGYNPARLTADGVKVYTVKRELFGTGVTEKATPFGNTVKVYDMERTVCDIVRSRSTVGTQILGEALKRYVKRKDRNLHLLMEYAAMFRVDRIVRNYLEVLL
jgi:predicted transcriptional regulator of viral defense system